MNINQQSYTFSLKIWILKIYSNLNEEAYNVNCKYNKKYCIDNKRNEAILIKRILYRIFNITLLKIIMINQHIIILHNLNKKILMWWAGALKEDCGDQLEAL